MRYRVMISVAVEAHSERQAEDQARKLKELLSGPLVKLAVESEGVRLAEGDGRPIVYQPQREGA